MNRLDGKTVIVGVSGGIAAYKTCELVSRLVQNGAAVHVIMTRNATEFVAPLSFESLSRNRVVTDTFDRNFTWEVEHVALAKKADAVVIAPATANVIAKIAHGIADDFLTTTVLACKCPIVFAPAMNSAMLDNPVTKENISKLSARGYVPVYGGDGYLACGDVGKGRMAEPDVLYGAVSELFDVKQDLSGKTVLVTAGATRAELDPVRFISNRSSGKMGYSIAAAAYRRGAKVVFVRGFTDNFDLPAEWKTVDTCTTAEMFEAVKSNIKDVDICIMAAAPCDYEANKQPDKIKDAQLTLCLKKTDDIAAWVGKNKGGKKLAVFAAETENSVRNAREKLINKNADLAVLNDVTVPGAGFDTDTNIVTLITEEKTEALPIMKKSELADVILDNIIGS